MTEILERAQWTLPGKQRGLPGGYALVSVTAPTVLLQDTYKALREEIVTVSDKAFGRSTAHLWEEKFTAGFLGALSRFYLVLDSDGALVGWSGYRARSIGKERIVYFASTGLLPRCQGHGLIRAVQRFAMARESRLHPFMHLSLAIRTRNPNAYCLALRTFGSDGVAPAIDGEVPIGRRAVVAAAASWLEFGRVDSATAIVRGAYPVCLYGQDPQSSDAAVNGLFSRLNPNDALLILGRLRKRSAVILAMRGR